LEPKEVQPYRPATIRLNTKPLTPLVAFGDPESLNLTPCKKDAPSVAGYRCVAAWQVTPTPKQEERFAACEEAFGNVVVLYHGTPAHNIEAIARDGLRPGSSACMFGSGIYAGPIQKAIGYTGQGQAKYIFRLRIALGSVLMCMTAQKVTLKQLTSSGHHSVGAIAGQTASWNGATLRYSENVVYSPDQVLVERVYEYQMSSYVPPPPETGSCMIVVEKKVAIPKGGQAFKDLLGRGACGAPAANRVLTDNKDGFGQAWICASCIRTNKLKKGSKIEVQVNRWKREFRRIR
jgi:hypothetical protein